MDKEVNHFRLRIPQEMHSWVQDQARRNVRSVNAEIVFLIREKMAAGAQFADSAPATECNNTVLPGGAV